MQKKLVKPVNGLEIESDSFSPVLNTSKEAEENSLKNDIEELNGDRKLKQNVLICDHVFNNELAAYMQEHGYTMSSKEKKRLKAIIMHKVIKGDIYMNSVGKIVIRKGQANTIKKKKKK